MSKKIDIKSVINTLKTSNFLFECAMPLGYTAGLPVLQIVNDRLCLKIPYLKYKVTGEVDKTLVYPIRYVVTVLLPEGSIVGFEDLTMNDRFKNVHFYNPVGLFRHEAVKSFSKKEYNEKRDELMGMYDKVANALVYGDDYTEEDDNKFSELLKIMVEPSVLPIYKAIDRDFYDKYLN